ncbi:hypothetical protein FOT57_05595 [Serratia ureilytica]|uniref:hypothetical protein n=1 Tax=Serratia ureilytica TaxID=300181 RepID=UPI0011C70362|nr:hypothetical protein [Serratia ureilytica]MBS7522447.1 hypothetical protein [Serratia ureilytica]TXE59786.1 hypothetical protein FOT57_05595 [Serratia ureilytica]
MFISTTVTHCLQNRGLSENYVENDEKWQLFVNVEHIVKFYRLTRNSYTLLVLAGGEAYGVQETPEELYAFLTNGGVTV